MVNEEGIDVQSILIEGSPDKEIINKAKKNDLISIGSNGTSAFNRIFLNSLSEKILHNAPSTVMIVR